ncbi:hypothetical protein [uncultured Fusobacterium sp.]|uniref:hypothetical protein n=1 Tax=uncultured Fusobacterium sp. TaxID=159267 RepID=UPI0027DC2B2E|nr:hypothetical protein [uncultured Fusobacterium sp.]
MIKRNIKEYYEREKEKYFDYFILGISGIYLFITAGAFWLSFLLYHNTNIVGIILGFFFLAAYIVYFKMDKYYKFTYFLVFLVSTWVASAILSTIISLILILPAQYLKYYQNFNFKLEYMLMLILVIRGIIGMFINSFLYQLFKKLSYKHVYLNPEKYGGEDTEEKEKEDDEEYSEHL